MFNDKEVQISRIEVDSYYERPMLHQDQYEILTRS